MKDILEWKLEVNNYNSSLRDLLENKSNLKDSFYGFEVIDGQLKENPSILFIGINPGIGNGKYNRDVFETEQISYLDVYDENYREDYPNTYHLAEKTLKFFREIGWEEGKIKEVFENKVVKTNFYHLATKDVSDLKTVLGDININGDYFNKSAEFSINLIKILKPKLVILEGRKVFDHIVEDCYELKKWDNAKKYGYLYDSELDIHIVGYSRGRNLTTEQRSHFTNKLKEILSQYE